MKKNSSKISKSFKQNKGSFFFVLQNDVKYKCLHWSNMECAGKPTLSQNESTCIC